MSRATSTVFPRKIIKKHQPLLPTNPSDTEENVITRSLLFLGSIFGILYDAIWPLLRKKKEMFFLYLCMCWNENEIDTPRRRKKYIRKKRGEKDSIDVAPKRRNKISDVEGNGSCDRKEICSRLFKHFDDGFYGSSFPLLTFTWKREKK